MSCISSQNKLVLEFDIPVSVNHYTKLRTFIKNVKGKPKAMVSKYETKEAKDFKKRFVKYIKEQIKEQGFEVKLDKYQFTHVDVTWYFPRIDMDSNNYWKVSLDCLTEAGVWVDDNTTLERAKRIYYDPKNPRMIMEIYYSDYIGIFENQAHLDEFLSKCIQCSKYRNGKCGVLTRAKQSRIQEEIQDFVCTKYTPKANK